MNFNWKRYAAEPRPGAVSSLRQLAVKRYYYKRNKVRILAALKAKRDAERGGPPRPWIRQDARPSR